MPIEDQINSAIDNLSESQIREIISQTLAYQSALTNIDHRIQAQQKFWQNMTPEKISKRHIETSMAFFYNHFKTAHNLDVDSLHKKSPFSQNMISHLVNDPAQCVKNMRGLCNYLAALSVQPREKQQKFFDSFPPKKPEEIGCQSGTTTRCDQEVRKLTIPLADKPLFDSHDRVVHQIIDKFRHHVDPDFQIHELPFMNFSLNLEDAPTIAKRDGAFSTPQFEIPAHMMFKELRNYAPTFRKILKKELNENVQKFLGACQKFSATDILHGTKEVWNKFRAESGGYGDPMEFLDIVDENDPNKISAEWSKEKITQILLERLCPRILIKESQEEPSRQNEIAAITSENGLFETNTPDHLARILQSENPEELMVGMQALWVLGSSFAGNSQIQFRRTIEKLEAVQKNFLQENLKAKLPQNCAEKIDFLCGKLLKDFPQSENTNLKFLLENGAPTAEILNHLQSIQNTEILALPKSCYKQLVARPDCKNLISALKRNSDHFPPIMRGNLLIAAAQINDLELCQDYLLNDVHEENPLFFLSNDALIAATKHKNATMVDLFLCKGAKLLIDEISNGYSALHHAARKGSAEVIQILKKHDADMNVANENGLTPLHLAARLDKNMAIETLLKNGADVNARDFNDATALYYATEYGNPEAIKTLVKFSSSNKKPFTGADCGLMRLAVESNQPKSFTTLEALGMEPQQAELNSYAQIAAEQNYHEMLEEVLCRGAKTPYFFFGNGLDKNTKKILHDFKPFTDVSRAISNSAIKNLPKPNNNELRDLLELEGRIRRQLCETYEKNSEEMKRDIGFSYFRTPMNIKKIGAEVAKQLQSKNIIKILDIFSTTENLQSLIAEPATKVKKSRETFYNPNKIAAFEDAHESATR